MRAVSKTRPFCIRGGGRFFASLRMTEEVQNDRGSSGVFVHRWRLCLPLQDDNGLVVTLNQQFLATFVKTSFYVLHYSCCHSCFCSVCHSA